VHDRQHPVLLDSPNRNYAAAPSRATVRIALCHSLVLKRKITSVKLIIRSQRRLKVIDLSGAA